MLDWLFEREKTWVVLNTTKSAYFFLGSNGAVLTHALVSATRFTKKEAKRLVKELGWRYTYIEADDNGCVKKATTDIS